MYKLDVHAKLAVVSLIVLMAAALPAQADMRCGTSLIVTGDSALKMLNSCGKPAVGDSSNLQYGEWIYNFGPEKFIIKVTIINGQVDTFETLGRGYITGEDGALSNVER